MTTLRQRQRGVSLLIVIVVVLLTMLMTVWASKTALLNELIVGNDADYQRAFEAAQAMLQDAEQDILGQNIDGSACVPTSDPKVCRTAGSVWFIGEDKDFVALLATLEAAASVPCVDAICAKRTGKQDFWNDKELLDKMRQQGARYGMYTGAQKGSYSNPILQATAEGAGAWYWVEVMPYASSAGALITNNPRAEPLALNLKPALVYRITAIAQGLKSGTQVVLQSTLARQKIKD
jgi:type IV pilus assembly protein PilX